MTTIVYVDNTVYTDDLALIYTNDQNYVMENTNTPKIFPIHAVLVEGRKRKQVTIGAICMAGLNPDFSKEYFRMAMLMYLLNEDANASVHNGFLLGDVEKIIFSGKALFILTATSNWYYVKDEKYLSAQDKKLPLVLGTGAEFSTVFLKSEKGKSKKEREQMMSYISKYDFMTSPNTFTIDVSTLFDTTGYDLKLNEKGEVELRKAK